MKIHFESSPRNAGQSRGLPVDYAAARRNIPAWRWNLIVLLMISPVIYFIGRALLERVWISAPGRIELQRATFHAGPGGRIDFLVAAGERVAAGALLATLTPSPAAGPPPPGPADADAAARLLAYRRERVAAYRRLLGAGAATQAEMDQALNLLREAEGVGRRLRAELAAAAARAPAAERIVAPFAGTVAQVAGQAGDRVAAGAELLTLVDEEAARVVAYLDSRLSRHAEPGRRVRLQFRDGFSRPARVLRVEVETAPPPAEPGTPFAEGGGPALQLVLTPEEPFPERYRRHRLPVSVHFDPAWLPGGGAILPARSSAGAER